MGAEISQLSLLESLGVPNLIPILRATLTKCQEDNKDEDEV